MATTTHSPLICTCGISFTPIIGYSGIIASRLCPDCRHSIEMAKRKLKVNAVVTMDIKTVKKALKSKLAPVRKSRTTERKLIEKLDREFSLFIRHRDTANGSFVCISCGKHKPYAQADCGHYFNRQYMSVRFDEINCNAQCRSCNRFKEGDIQGYRYGLIRKHGEHKVDELYVKKTLARKYAVFELETLIVYYKQQNKDYLLNGDLF